ncbi:MAG: site-specific DNA-methyltransferase [Candidatus Omnitrophica bacterium]|nr:site-specific DNA-methyltransferase [Candidatus Nanoarchaeia archaeon]MDD5551440.1 site-specific DNA-methyltransferase [Candidatus Omnitrophota bacterium]
MNELTKDSIDLIVTSPPYFNALNYDSKNKNNRSDMDYNQFLKWLGDCFKECLRVLKPGRMCCVVISTVLYNQKSYALPYHFVSLMEQLGFEFHQDIIWRKMTANTKRVDITVQNPYPGYYYPIFTFEHILVFKKPGPKIYSGRTRKERFESRIPINEFFVNEISNNVWNINTIAPYQYDHPCPFPEEIPHRLIMLYSYKGDVVLDPFLGSGTTAAVALAMNRRFCGYDIRKRYIDLTRKRLDEPVFLGNGFSCEYKKLPRKLLSPKLNLM